MASTDREFDDEKILQALQNKFGLIVPENAESVDIEVEYDAPVVNHTVGAYFNISLRIRTNSETADEILRAQL
ncbi:hypothetical protein [Microcella alkalica]|uniref:hypothetical protein n=1 Tax=Microcella alkalica TaxID=355930 RepID=UPI00145D434B|nr:hypothetical protein [Microcella alkalica]